ncbi:glucans biosynthesis glucosyltransferase MdoH [Neptunomonas phycophila]|uniref:Glucans biosynthesis glucosyltransferase H n=1 Tax=Neptunomonas phycophila TaxID=1572645 RepID=A0ABT9ETT7_9GAMM|nr:glucans biosynthesis glucosyltransferase MdoH [Neptunomonas phycophila]MDP2522489.1 glucans biosynthesis glucosyltransferase MdoH [Neptunomonas phycophila]
MVKINTLNENIDVSQEASGMPPVSPADMPEQSLKHFRRRGVRTPVNPKGVHSPAWRRLLVLGSAVALSCWGIYEMYSVLALGELIFVENLVLVLFALTFSWITVAFAGSIIGFFKVIAQHKPLDEEPVALTKRTAVLMPTYNEQPGRIFSAIETMAKAIQAQGEGAAFDWFVLSDTTDVEVAIAEEVALQTLRHRLGSEVNVYYRRRVKNEAKKAGNVADFCKRWGGAYDHLLVLDADSLMEAKTMITLARRMEADPDAGLIQTIPQLINGTTLMARIQQFATRVYGPVVGSGLAWWTAKEGNFWGHNAIIRTEAFMSAAGLPHLRGKPPFGGHVLSHDFVEAALIRRAGWSVVIASDLDGSYEESPPSIIDLAVRDRRWCQGNLQHARVIGGSGLHWVSRSHLATGIMSYLSSPLWLLLILAGMALALQAQYIRPEYFSDEYSLFPTWPVIDAARALMLFLFTMGILFAPKVLGIIAFLVNAEQRERAGGTLRVLISFVVEIILSALVAPIMMLIHSGAVLSILIGRDAGWNPQRRDDGSLPLKDVIYRHRWHMVMGVILTAFAALNSMSLLAWLAPAVAGLLLAVPVSVITSSWSIGEKAKRWGILKTPEEGVPPAIFTAFEQTLKVYTDDAKQCPDFVGFVASAHWASIHKRMLDEQPPRARGDIDSVEALTAMKVAEAESVSEAIGFMTPKERLMMLNNPHLFEKACRLAVTEREHSYSLAGKE